MSRLPDPVRTFSKEFAELKRRFRDLEVRSAWTGSGMTPLGDGQTAFSPGIVPNNALGAPSIPGSAGVEATNFALATTLVEVAGVDLTVPVGTTRLLVSATGQVFAVNPGVATVLWASLKVGTVASTPLGVQWDATPGVATASAVLGTSVTGLTPGATVRLGVWASSTAARAANAGNTAALTASLTWTP